MENTISLFRIIHRVALSALLLLIAAMPLIVSMDIVTTLVVLPTLLIFLFSMGIIIEQKLDGLSKSIIKRKRHCLIINCLHKKCLS